MFSISAKEIAKVTEILCSVVVPVYNEEAVVAETYRRLKHVMDSLGRPYEIIFVDDGSCDRTWDILSSFCESDKSAKLIGFSRNFGHQAAITAGMDYSSGRAVVVIDADLQDPPELIPEMLKRWREGFDVVYGVRSRREGETLFKKATASLFYRLLRRMTDVEMPLDAGDFRLVDRKVCDALKKIPERNRYVRGLISWLGFRQTGIEYVREKRFAGNTKYPLKKMLKFACDGITSFSYQPLRLANWCGVLVACVSIVFLLASLFISQFRLAAPYEGTGMTGQAAVDTVDQNAADVVDRGGGNTADQSATDTSGQANEDTGRQIDDNAFDQNVADTFRQTVADKADMSAPDQQDTVNSSNDHDSGALSRGYKDSSDVNVSIFIAVSMLINGIVLITAGIIGIYVGRIYDEVKGRPLYVVKETRNFDDPGSSPVSENRNF